LCVQIERCIEIQIKSQIQIQIQIQIPIQIQIQMRFQIQSDPDSTLAQVWLESRPSHHQVWHDDAS